jgi:ribosome-associated protein
MRDLVVDPRVTIPASELHVSFSRSGGPGGQNVNKVSSKVELRWRPAGTAAVSGDDLRRLLERLGPRLTGAGELLVTSSLTRDQARNRQDALAKLAATVRAALVRPRRRKPTRPSRAAKQRRLQGKKQRGRTKQLRGRVDDG